MNNKNHLNNYIKANKIKDREVINKESKWIIWDNHKIITNKIKIKIQNNNYDDMFLRIKNLYIVFK